MFARKFCAFKRPTAIKTKVHKNDVFWWENLPISRIIEKLKKFLRKYFLSLLAGKLRMEKKGCAFELCLVLNRKYTKSFGGKKFAPC